MKRIVPLMRKHPIRNDTVLVETGTRSAAVAFDPGDDAIAKLAYQLWTERGRPEGSAEEDWYRAQELLRNGRAVTASSI